MILIFLIGGGSSSDGFFGFVHSSEYLASRFADGIKVTLGALRIHPSGGQS